MNVLENRFSRLLEAFLDYLSVERNFSENTRKSYRNDLQRYLLAMQECAGSPEAINRTMIEGFVAELRDAGLEASSIARNVSAIRSLHRFLLLERLLEPNPAEHLHQPKLGRYLPTVLSIEETISILEAPMRRTPPPPYPLRDRAILELLYATGMRVSELAGLRNRNLYLDEQFVRIFGKGSRERLVPAGSQALEWVSRYLQEERIGLVSDESDDHLFLNRRGQKLSRMSVFTLVRQSAAFAGIEKTVSPHTFRHTFATHLLEGGADLRAVQEMLGHSSIVATQIYTHIDRTHVKEVHRSFHPRG